MKPEEYFEEWWNEQFYNDNLKDLLRKSFLAGYQEGRLRILIDIANDKVITTED
jgi:hypothetical protein